MAMFRFVFLLHILLLMRFASAAKFSKMFEQKMGLDDNGQAVFWSVKSPSIIACVAHCLGRTGCLGVVYNNFIQTCSYLNSIDSLFETTDDGFSFVFVGEYCLEGWVEFKGSCYLFGNQTFPWSDALDFCNMQGATLVEIGTQDENVFIQTTLSNIVNQEHWIGMNEKEDGSWGWASGAVVNYTGWSQSQPDEYSPENCAAIWASFSYKWVDEPCAERFYPICEHV